MSNNEKLIPVDDYLVRPNQKLHLKNFHTEYKGDLLNKQESEVLLELSRKHLAEIQDELYAHSRYSVLIIFQGMDAAGKDGAVKHIMTGFNPQGVRVYSFKAPTATELDHDYFWRHNVALPARGEIAIHNRSHYENVLVTRVHPEYILRENIPGVESEGVINETFWQQRFHQIRRFEENLTENGTIILKFFLHLSKDEQKKRFIERIDDPTKNWKFSLADLKERQYWDAYQAAFQEAITATSTDKAPWFIIPADDKWYARLLIATIIHQQFLKLKLSYPVVSEEQRQRLQEAKTQLLTEDGGIGGADTTTKKDKKEKKKKKN